MFGDDKIVYKKNFIERLCEKLKGKKITSGKKEIFEFKELPFFFRNNRRYGKHVKNVLSVTKNLIGDAECNIHETQKKYRENENKDTKKKRKRLVRDKEVKLLMTLLITFFIKMLSA